MGELWLPVLLSMQFGLTLIPSALAVEYRITDLGTLGGEYSGAADINNAGQVVGYAGISSGSQHACRWDPDGTAVDLNSAVGGIGYAFAINESGQAVGQALYQARYRAVLWEANGDIRDLGTLPGRTGGKALAVNNHGQVVGYSFLNYEGQNRAFLWDPVSGMTDLGTLGGTFSEASGINDAGKVVGCSTTAAGKYHAFVWTASTGMVDVHDPTMHSSNAQAINNNGIATGGCCLLTGGMAMPTNVFLWNSLDGLQDVGGLGPWNFGQDINSNAEVAGQYQPGGGDFRAFRWDSVSGFQELPYLLGDHWSAGGINDDGLIAGAGNGFGYGGSHTHAMLWTPIKTIEAAVEIKPDTLNLKSKGEYVTVYIELPAGERGLEDIDVSSLRLNATIEPAEERQPQIGDYDSDGIPDLMVKFDREALCGLLSAGEQTVTLTGSCLDGADLTGQDTIRVLEK